MKIQLRPELEEMIKQDVERGPWQSVDEFVEDAISQLHEQEAWLSQQKERIAKQIEEGYVAAERGELVDSAEARATLKKRKREWLADKRRL